VHREIVLVDNNLRAIACQKMPRSSVRAHMEPVLLKGGEMVLWEKEPAPI
jgi:hypothetical protein